MKTKTLHGGCAANNPNPFNPNPDRMAGKTNEMTPQEIREITWAMTDARDWIEWADNKYHGQEGSRLAQEAVHRLNKALSALDAITIKPKNEE